ncbi:hypothetical protein ACOI22_03315 [Glaciecola sp. 2405UD65-10]|uniref:hypothetical protein n=1 Tax=Glaciecola sp. 2405UD65-10 TaxID=3397244 RepID=UPI003B5A212B
MKITITDDATNEIVKTMYCPAKWHTSQVKEGQTLHKGNYPKDVYTYNGTTFDLINNDVINKQTDRTLINSLSRSMRKAGLNTEHHITNLNTRLNCYNAIDQAAGRARMRLVSQGLLIDLEYTEVANQVQAWRNAGSIEADAPRAINDDWRIEKGQTIEQAAQDVENIKAVWDDALMQIRNLRLKGKSAIDNAQPSQFNQVAEQYINELENLSIASV